MIPRLDPDAPVDPVVGVFAAALRAGGFQGRVLTRLSERVVRATDNSLYQFLPAAAIEPLDHADCSLALTLLGETRFEGVSLTARGGGTGTSAMALTHGVVLDFARMNRVHALDPAARTARVEPGVTLAQINDAARPHGLMFAPHVSTGDRATIGGMIATDAAGKGSARYGKTSDHVVSLRVLFAGGEEIETADISDSTLHGYTDRSGCAGELCRAADEIDRTLRDEIDRVFPMLPRRVTGYNLAMIRRNPSGGFSLNHLLCGSEGTLGIVTEATLRLTPIPAHRALVAVSYGSFGDAVRDAVRIAGHMPQAIETMDAMVLDLARGDEAYPLVERYIEPGARALTLVEFAGDDAGEPRAQAVAFAASDARSTLVPGAEEIAGFWALRSRAVGVLGALPGSRKPSPFVEDAGVPLERLPAFIEGFDAILAAEGLTCGRFGHLDAGVIHIRPAIDTTNDDDLARVRRVSDAVARLAKDNGGVLWGEHGKGVRGEYNAFFFGATVDAAMRRIKGAADPGNQLNPGKIAAPPNSSAVMLTVESTTRGELDRDVPAEARAQFDDPFRCNGNAVCHSDRAEQAMCPSWKETRDRRHSPKGRADLMREWLRRVANAGGEPGDASRGVITRAINTARGGADFSHEVKEAMDGCLACKACAGQCPVKVDVPAFRAVFLHAYHGRYRRRLREHVLARAERLAARPAPGALMRLLGVIDLPSRAKPSLALRLRDDPAARFDPASVGAGDVVILPDAFTAAYEPGVIVATLRLARSLGRTVHLAPVRESGKALHVLGMLDRFRRVAEREAAWLGSLSHATLVGIDPAITLLYRDEYPRTLGRETTRVLLPQEWLASLEITPLRGEPTSATLLPHCTERAMEPRAAADWNGVFARFGVQLAVRDVGCCGMAGMYGHLAENADRSRGIFDRSWAGALDGVAVLATGYSCRSQAERYTGRRPLHPLEYLARRVVSSAP